MVCASRVRVHVNGLMLGRILEANIRMHMDSLFLQMTGLRFVDGHETKFEYLIKDIELKETPSGKEINFYCVD